MTFVKICGIFDEDAARTVAELPVNYVGFVFAPSRRQVSPERAGKLGSLIPSAIHRIGVFVDEEVDTILSIGDIAHLDGFQLHGNESPTICRYLKERSGKLVWKAWRVREGKAPEELTAYQGIVDAVLLDSFSEKAHGGTGEAFAWEEIAQIRSRIPNVPLIIAGGLTSENIRSLLSFGGFMGVDVSSGVESSGRKDPIKMKEFVQKVREWDGMA